jgi:hypothetical protein
MTPEDYGAELAALLAQRRRQPADLEARVGYVTILSVSSPYATVAQPDGSTVTYPHGAIVPLVGARWRVLWALGTGLLDDWAPERPVEPFTPEPPPEEGDPMLPFLGTATLTPGTPGSGSTPVSGTVTDTESAALTSARAILEISVTDGTTDAEPSATATLTSPLALAGAGTATLLLRVDTAGAFTLTVTSSAATRYLWVRQGPGSPVWVRQASGPTAVTIA